MSKKAKFKPEIIRIKLNPEQAVLACEGYNTGYKEGGPSKNNFCSLSPKNILWNYSTYVGTTSS